MIDVTHEIDAIRRQVGDRVLEAGTARVVTVGRTYDTDLDDLWDACTTAERIARWLTPVTGDLRVGGRYQLEGNAGGEVLTCDPPRAFTATWEYGGDVSWIELRLTAQGPDRTRFELEHLAHVDDERWTEFGPGAVGVGWDLSLLGLSLYLATGAAAVADPAGWMASEEGKQFVTQSSERWIEADAAAGTPAEDARARGDRTTAAYTTPEG
jgi:uncharacterized protein YndB with AHSA1/START domain